MAVPNWRSQNDGTKLAGSVISVNTLDLLNQIDSRTDQNDTVAKRKYPANMAVSIGYYHTDGA